MGATKNASKITLLRKVFFLRLLNKPWKAYFRIDELSPSIRQSSGLFIVCYNYYAAVLKQKK